MSAPTTLAKVRAALKRFVPPLAGWLSDTSKLGLERDSLGYAIARANDVVESIYDELFADTATLTIDRLEKIYRVPSRPGDSTATRQSRVLTVIRRVNGPQLSRLSAALASVLATDAANLVFLETMRSQIEAALTLTTGTISQALPATFMLGAPFPGNVDDTGVSVYLSFFAAGGTSATLTHPDGTQWTFVPSSMLGWYSTRTVFFGKPAAGNWTLAVSGPSNCIEARLLVSNDVDAAQIYKWHVVRDPGLAGTPDLVEAQRQLMRYELGHMLGRVCERQGCVVDDPHSICDRDPVGV